MPTLLTDQQAPAKHNVNYRGVSLPGAIGSRVRNPNRNPPPAPEQCSLPGDVEHHGGSPPNTGSSDILADLRSSSVPDHECAGSGVLRLHCGETPDAAASRRT